MRKFYSDLAFFSAFFNFQFSIKFPNSQYGTTKVNKKINIQNPMVKMVRKTKNPKNTSISILIVLFSIRVKNKTYFEIINVFEHRFFYPMRQVMHAKL